MEYEQKNDNKEEEQLLQDADIDMEGAEQNKHATLADEKEEDVKVEIEGHVTEFGDHVEYLKSNKDWESLKLPKDLIQNLIAKGYRYPSKIQASAISLFQKKSLNTDVIAQSQNGSGKTLAFLIPSIITVDTSIKVEKKGVLAPQVILIGDTRELTYQTYKILNLIAPKRINIEFNYAKKDKGPNQDCHIFVTTLGSLSNMVKKKKLTLSNVKLFVIDEADKLIESDNNKSTQPQIYKSLPSEARIYLFSATFPEKSYDFLNMSKRKFTKITIENKHKLSLSNLKHYYVRCQRNEKLKFMDAFQTKFLEGSVIIFVSSKNFANMFGERLSKKGHKSDILLNDMSNEDRVDVLNDFKTGKVRVLVSTNLISRGIDARKTSLVVNVDLPYMYKSGRVQGDRREKIDCETYLHRGGRTARFGDQGMVINLIEDDRNYRDLAVLEKEYGIKMNEATVDNFEQVIKQSQENNEFNTGKRKYLEEDL